jgi:hypothetical protein
MTYLDDTMTSQLVKLKNAQGYEIPTIISTPAIGTGQVGKAMPGGRDPSDPSWQPCGVCGTVSGTNAFRRKMSTKDARQRLDETPIDIIEGDPIQVQVEATLINYRNKVTPARQTDGDLQVRCQLHLRDDNAKPPKPVPAAPAPKVYGLSELTRKGATFAQVGVTFRVTDVKGKTANGVLLADILAWLTS